MKKPDKESRRRKEGRLRKGRYKRIGVKEGKILTTQRSSSGHRRPSLRR